MTEPTSHRTYEVRINGLAPAGAVAEQLLAELGDVEITGHDVTTVLSGWFPDQQALAEFLRRLRAYGLEVVEIRRLAEDEPAGRPEGTPAGPPEGRPGTHGQVRGEIRGRLPREPGSDPRGEEP